MGHLEIIGYFLEYWVAGKMVGTLLLEEPDRKEVGYYSKQVAIAEEDIILQKNKKIKKGAEYYTRMYPINGRMKKD